MDIIPENTMPNNTLGEIAHNGIGLDKTRGLPPAIKPDAPLLDRLAALSTWLGEFPFQQACVQGERVVNEAIAAIEGLHGELEERTQYAPSLNDADVIAAVRSAADEAATNSTRIGAPGSDIRVMYATQASMLYAAAARLDALLKAAQESQ